MMSNGRGSAKFGGTGVSSLRSGGSTPPKPTNFLFRLEKQLLSKRTVLQGLLAAPANASVATVDIGLVAAGIAAAMSSAIFAGYMIARDNSHPTFGGAEHLMLFAQPLGGGSLQRKIDAGVGEDQSVDYNATGSIRRVPPGEPSESRGGAAQSGADKIQADATRAQLKGYILSFVQNGAAIIRSAQGSYVVSPGATLPGGGKVLAIERRADKWIVVTARGIITEEAP